LAFVQELNEHHRRLAEQLLVELAQGRDPLGIAEEWVADLQAAGLPAMHDEKTSVGVAAESP